MIKILLWVIIIAILLTYFIFKAKHVHNKFYLTSIIVLLIFFFISASIVISTNNIDVTSIDGMVTASKAYFRWVGNVIGNSRTIVGDAIRMDWSSANTLK
jgi:energy-coupling factor transporter transmembrane protein EcfT